MSLAILHVVMVDVGDYSDRNTDVVCAFLDGDAANRFVVDASAEERSLRAVCESIVSGTGVILDSWRLKRDNYAARRAMSTLDTHGTFDDGPRYYVLQVPLSDDVRVAIADEAVRDMATGRAARRISLSGVPVGKDGE